MMVGIRYAFIAILCMSLGTSQETKTILFFGDSLTAGNGVSPEEAFPALIEKRFKQSQRIVKVVNAGLSGETSAGGLGRIDWVLRQPVDVFVLELGANDGLRGLPVDQMEKNLQAIIDKVKAKYPDASIVMVGMMALPNMGEDYSGSFQKVFPNLAKRNNITLMPFLLDGVAGNEKLNVGDGLHPNAEGHKIVARNLFTILEKMI